MNGVYFLRNMKRVISTFSKSTPIIFSTSNRINYLGSVRNMHVSFKLYSDVIKEKEENIHVYEGPLKTKVKIVKFLSLSSSMFGFSMLPVVLNDLVKVNVWVGCTVAVVSTFFLSTPFLLHWITKGYVLDLYYNAQTGIFTATTYNIISQRKNISFNAEDVSVPELPGMFTSFHVRDLSLFVDSSLVKDPDAYSHMMGYDKPLDFKLYENNQKERIKPS